jgi:hypothetical protein
MKAQEFANQPAIRIKLASVAAGGFLTSDATSEEYDPLFQELPTGWTIREDGQITTRAEGSRRAWLLDKDGVEIAVEAHETGVEIVLGVAGVIAAGVAVDLAKDAVVGFAKWLWRRWKGLRAEKEQKQTAVDPSLRLVCYTAQLPGGSITTVSMEVRAPLTDEGVAQCLTQFLTDYGMPLPPSPPPPKPSNPQALQM